MEPIYILSGVRTAIGDFGGSLKDIPPARLGALVIAEAVKRAGVTGDCVQHVVMGNVILSEPKDAYLARVAALEAGVPIEAPALTLNRLCGSGVQAIISAAQMVALGECGIAVAGGAESMSRSPHHVTTARFGQKMGNVTMIDALTAVLSDPLEGMHMGVTAENVAADHGITRQMQDELAVLSHQRAAQAQAEGRFDSQILPVDLKTRNGATRFDRDEHVRADASVEGMAKLKAVFQKDGTVTAGNSSGINDGAAAVVLMTASEAAKRGKTPLARIVSWAHAGVDPAIMGTGPIPASRAALKKAGWNIGDLDLIEANEAFAAQACAVNKDLGWDPSKVNVNGGAIAIGHPIGASGGRVLVTLLYEMQKRNAKKGLATLCIGGGMGIAMCVER